MTIHAKPPPGANRGGGSEMSIGSIDPTVIAIPAPAQITFDAASINCAQMRADELRDCLLREISHSVAIELQAQAYLFDGNAEDALETLRRHWHVMRADISPMAAELGALLKRGRS